MNISHKRDGLRKVYVDGFIRRKVLIVRIRIFNGAILHAGAATRAVILYDISGLFI
jgi:hypothetical protein